MENQFGALPVGFGMALAQRPGAMERFVQLSPAAQSDVLHRAQQAQSRNEMRALVESLTDGGVSG